MHNDMIFIFDRNTSSSKSGATEIVTGLMLPPLASSSHPRYIVTSNTFILSPSARRVCNPFSRYAHPQRFHPGCARLLLLLLLSSAPLPPCTSIYIQHYHNLYISTPWNSGCYEFPFKYKMILRFKLNTSYTYAKFYKKNKIH